MADDVASLSIKVDSRQVKSADTDLDKFSASADKAEKSTGEFEKTSKKTSNATAALAKSLKAASVAAIAYVGVVVGGKLKNAADEYTRIQNALRQVTTGTENLTRVTNTLFQVAEQSRSNVSATAELYQKLALSTTELGLSQSEIVRLTGTINKSFALSGATAQEAAGAIRQLGQGLASGALRGDEFNSVAEQAPGIMRAIAKETGKSIGELRDFAAEGKITADIVVAALQNAGDQIDNDFANSVMTFDQSMEQIENRFIKFAGENEDLQVIMNAVGEVMSVTADIALWLLDGLLQAGRGVVELVKLFGEFVMSSETVSSAINTIIQFSQLMAENWEVGLLGAIGMVSNALITFAEVVSTPFVAAFSVIQTAILDFVDNMLELSIIASDFIDISDETINKMRLMQSNTTRAAEKVAEFGKKFDDARAKVNDFVSSSQEVARAQDDVNETLEDGGEVVGMVVKEAGKYSDSVQDVIDKLNLEVAALDESNKEKGVAAALAKAGVKANSEEGRAITALIKKINAKKKAKKDLEKAEKALVDRVEDAIRAEEEQAKATQKLLDKLDPTTAKMRELTEEAILLRNAFEDGLIDSAEFDKLNRKIQDSMKTVGTDAGVLFSNAFFDEATDIGSSLQDAIISGDWSGIGDTIGGTLAGATASAIEKGVGGLAGSLLGGIGGGVVGSLVGAAFEGVKSLLGDVVDPTEQRQSEQGTGTVLGSIDAKSQSIADSVDEVATSTADLVGINTGMLNELKGLQGLFVGAASDVARARGNLEIAAPRVDEQIDLSDLAFGSSTLGGLLADTAVSGLLNGVTFGLGSLLTAGAKSKQIDEGIQIVGGSLQEIIDNTIIEGFATFKVRKNYLDDYDKKERFASLGDEVNNQFGEIFAGIADTVIAGAESLGLSQDEINSALEQVVVETQKISLEGLDAAAQQAEIQAVFSKVFDDTVKTVVPFLTEMQRAGEGLGETLTRVSTEFAVAQEAYRVLGFQVGETIGDFVPTLAQFVPLGDKLSEMAVPTELLVAAASELVELSGGLAQFSTNLSAFEKNFLDVDERISLSGDRLTQALGDLPLPETREGFRDLFKAQDASTRAGRENIATLLELQGAADQYYNLLESNAEDVVEAIDGMAESTEGLIDVAAELQLQISNLSSATDAALDSLRQSIQAEKDTLSATYREEIEARKDASSDLIASIKKEGADRANSIKDGSKVELANIRSNGEAQVAAIKEQEKARLRANKFALDAAREGLRAISEEVRGITSALDNLQRSTTDNEVQRARALSVLRNALVTGDLSGTGEAAGIAANIQQQDFATAEDFNRQVGVTKGVLSELSVNGQSQKTNAEKTIERLEAQTEEIKESSDRAIAAAKQNVDDSIFAAQERAAEALEAAEEQTERAILAAEDQLERELAKLEEQYLDEIDRLDGLLTEAENQLNALRDIDASVKSVEEAVQGFNAALEAERVARQAAEAEAARLAEASSVTEVVEEAPLPSAPPLIYDFSGVNLDVAPDPNSLFLIPQFADGGDHLGGTRMVGEEGPELEFTGPSRIMNHQDFMAAMSNDELQQEIKQLRDEMRQALFAVARNTLQTTKQLDRWDGDGMPGTRSSDVSKVEVV